jgi:hypothetical protein
MENTQLLKFMVDRFNHHNLELATESGMSDSDAALYVEANREYAFIILHKLFKDMVSEGHLNP